MGRSEPFVTLDPTGTLAAKAAAHDLPARPSTLDGAVVGLLANGKPNSEEILDLVYDELAGHFSLAGAVRICKESVSVPPSGDEFDRLTSDVDVVVTALGD